MWIENLTLKLTPPMSRKFYLSLFEGKEGEIVYQKGSMEIELCYNKSYYSLPTTNQKPDIVLGIKNGRIKVVLKSVDNPVV